MSLINSDKHGWVKTSIGNPTILISSLKYLMFFAADQPVACLAHHVQAEI
jgi:hypothetical protein